MVPDDVRRCWRTLAGDRHAFRPATTTVVRGSRGIGPDGWTGVVHLGDACVIEAGDTDDDAVAVLRALDDPSEPEQVARALCPSGTLGPAELAYLPMGASVMDPGLDGDVREVPVASIRGWLDALPEDDVEESSVGQMERVLVLRHGEQVAGAAGHLDWPAAIGHLGVLVSPLMRGRGVGVGLGAAATRRAFEHGLTPQWRAARTNAASRQIARHIGYREMGRQFSFRLG